MQTLQITPPNTCALLDDGASVISYVDSPAPAQIFANDALNFTEYLTPNDALTAALVIDPTYDGEIILGPLPVSEDTATGAGEYFYGDPVTLDFVVSCTDPSTIAYQWYEDDLAISGETSSTLSLGAADANVAGQYSCTAIVTATDGSNRIATVSQSFPVTCIPVAGNFTLTRLGNDITGGLLSYHSGFTDTDASLVIPALGGLTISYVPGVGFQTTGSPLTGTDEIAEIRIKGHFVDIITIYAAAGTFSHRFSV